MTNNLVRTNTAAEALGLKRVTFVARNYPIAEIIDGVKYYDVEELKEMVHRDKRRKQYK